MDQVETLDERKKVALEALRVLAGADDIRRQLLAGLAMGSRSVESQAYQIKCRVKEHEKIVEKVFDRRRNGKPDYTASDVTDIVGLRILSLYRAELPLMVRQFLEFVKFGQQDQFDLFPGITIKDCLKEVILYQTSDVEEVYQQLIINQFKKYSIRTANEGQDTGDDSGLVIKLRRKETRYSSLHMVIRCHGFSRDKRFLVPLEVQIRTAFEDLWGEIEHQLRYKTGPQGGLQDSSQKGFYDVAMRHLTALKAQLDNCSSTADLIEEQVRMVLSAATYGSRQSIKTPSIDILKLNELPLSEEIKGEINQIVKELFDIYDLLDEYRMTGEIPYDR